MPHTAKGTSHAYAKIAVAARVTVDVTVKLVNAQGGENKYAVNYHISHYIIHF